MASLLRSYSVSKIFSDIRRVLTTRVHGYESLSVYRPSGQPLCPTITRLLSAQRPVENVSSSSTQSPGIDRALYRIDTDIRRTGRIFLRDVEDIFQEIKTLKHASSTQSLLLLRCCGSLVPEEHPEVRNKLVHDIWNTLQELKVPLDISHYNTLLRVYLENNHKFAPAEFLAQLEKNGVEPNRVTYQRLISRYCQEGDIEGATKILEFMKEKQLPVGENIFNALITGHAKSNDLESAWGVLDVMRSSGLEPSTTTYAALLLAHAEAGDAEGLNRTLQACEAEELTMHDQDLLEAVFTLATNGHEALVPQVIEKFHRQHGYGQDAINVIYRLINAGCHEVAHQIFSTLRLPQTGEGQLQSPHIGAFFIKHLVRSGTTSMTKVVEYCQDLKEKGLNPLALETALNSALVNGRHEEALFLMRVMKDEGCVIRTHFFWPILCQHAKNGDTQKIYDTVREMAVFNVPATLETLRYYILPGLAQEDKQLAIHSIIAGLKDAGVTVPLMVNGMVAFLLDSRNVVDAASLLTKYRVKVRSVLRRDLSDAYMKTGDASSVVTILGQMVDHSSDSMSGEKEESEGQKDADEEGESISVEEQRGHPQQQDVAALFLLDIAHQSQRFGQMEKLLAVLQEMEQRGLGISYDGGSAVKAKLNPGVGKDIIEALDRLCSGNLTFQPLPRENAEPYSQWNPRDLEERIKELENKNLPTDSVRSMLLVSYIKAKEVENAEALKKKIVDEGIPLGTGLHVLLMDMYVGLGELDKATSTLNELLAREPDTKLNHTKYLRLALLMAQQGKVEDVVSLVQQHVEQESVKEDPVAVSNNARRLLDYMTEHCGPQPAHQVLDLLLAHKVVQPSSLLFAPFIKAHLTNDDLASALQEFESVCQSHQVTPCKQELTTRCINLEDGERLQKIMDLSIQIHGEMNSLYDMVFAFVECGKVHQARKLIETPGLRAFNLKLEQKCKWLREMGKIEELSNLVSVTKDVFDVDRDMLYSNLLKAYVQRNDPDKALGVWTTMQEDDHRPSDAFLLELGQFLQSKGREVPFAMPLPDSVQSVSDAPQQTPEPRSTPQLLLRQALKKNDWTSALKHKKEVEKTGGKVSVTVTSELIEGLVKERKLDEATNLCLSMLAANTYPTPNIFKFLLLGLSNEGKVEPIEAFRKFIDDHSLKKRLSYDNLLCTAYVNAGKTQEVLQHLNNKLKETPDSELKELEMNFPRGGVMGILNKQTEYLPQILELAEEYAARGLLAPANCVWMHLFSLGQHDEAKQIYDKHLKDSPSLLMFRAILLKAENTGDVSLLSSLMEVLNGHPAVSNQAKGLVYNSWIDILCNANKFEEGRQILDSALHKINISELRRGTLTRLKSGLENAGHTFPYMIPSQVRQRRRAPASSSSSSSDSD